MYELLKKFMKLKELIAIYTDTSNCDLFAVGYVCRLCNDKVIMMHVGLHGEFDGYSVCMVEDIYRIEENSKYLQKINRLKKWDVSDVFKIEKGEEYFKAAIDTALKSKIIIAVNGYNSEFEVRGYVEERSETIIKMLQINEYGEEDGTTAICLDDVSRIIVGDVECMELDKLYHMNVAECINTEKGQL